MPKLRCITKSRPSSSCSIFATQLVHELPQFGLLLLHCFDEHLQLLFFLVDLGLLLVQLELALVVGALIGTIGVGGEALAA